MLVSGTLASFHFGYLCSHNWARSLGAPAFFDMKKATLVNLDYTVAGVKAITSSMEADPERKLRFVYCSGMAVEQDQKKSLYLFSAFRKMRVSDPH